MQVDEHPGLKALVKHRLTARRQQAVLHQKLQHEMIEKTWLLDLAGAACPADNANLTIRHTCLDGKFRLMHNVLAARQDSHRAFDRRMMIFRCLFCQRMDLMDDRVDIGDVIAFC
jgi:hypothetical protein